MRTGTTAVLCLLLSASAAAGPDAKTLTVKLSFRASRKREAQHLQLPVLRRFVGDGCSLLVGGKPLAPKAVGADLDQVDIGGRTFRAGDQIAPLRVDGPDGKPIPYALRVVAGEWRRPCLMADGAMVGKLAGIELALIDANMNGRYDDYGVDRMALHGARHAFPLSQLLVAAKDRAYRLKVAADGSSVEATPLELRWGTLDLTAGYAGVLAPELLVFERAEGDVKEYVPVAGARPARLPRGAWRLACGVMSKDVWLVGDPKAEPVGLGFAGMLRWGRPYRLLPEVRIGNDGRVRTVSAPGLYKAPRLTERIVRGKWLIMNFPPVVAGRAGERYVGPYERQDRMGTSLTDPKIRRFEVEISRGSEKLNVGQTRWEPYNLSGLVQKTAPYWLSYDFNARSVRGETVKLVVSADSPLFGRLTSEPLELRVPR